MATANLHRLVETHLTEHDVRYTNGRRALVGELVSAEGPRSAAELHTELSGRVPLSSIYRSLSVLESTGVLEPHHGTRGVTRYEIAEWLAGHHHHLVCSECGVVEDIEIPQEHERKLTELILTVSAASRFESTGHSLEIHGRCEGCR